MLSANLQLTGIKGAVLPVNLIFCAYFSASGGSNLAVCGLEEFVGLFNDGVAFAIQLCFRHCASRYEPLAEDGG